MEKAPHFCLEGITPDGKVKTICLDELLSQKPFLVLYFYPKDNTPGCTKEACEFRDNLSRITPYATVAGISPDSIKSHENFRKKHELNFYLLSDPEKEVCRLYGAYGEKKMYGKVREGVIRSTFIISSDGIILKSWRNVRVKGHVDKVIEELKRLSEGEGE